ncbi:SCO family protein [Komagataeibacter rhaeticus]|uniref:SCO family protein n=1 Tax=Komagataeibacter rhaeticus TaxID=215221 RepID=A0A181CE15_9PROT|nr:SCO family protein [Komagataeibacter rhaeticus]ATU71494.1 SCO family protein [Komagataeibacter xylinus]QIP36440.1 SCO family protein [Komagataeibacter rhaeticus]QOC46210.1 SCO family protein [Komagataeibacter rhaeticus]WPP21158.1 SCO family protein [Komagataeibacter rhaeticus]SAY49796.1 SCO1/SenC [Komagataeibacter rhaeticus]
MMRNERDRFFLLVGLAIVVVSSIFGYVGYRWSDSAPVPLTSYGNPVGGSFRLVNGADGSVLDTDFRGRWMLVYFGSTHCPDTVCGATVKAMAEGVEALGHDRARLAVPIFITLDPMRDTSDVLRTYALRYGSHVTVMTASPKMIEAVAKEYHAPYVRHEGENGDYTMEPATQIVIMSPTGRYEGSLPATATAAEITARMTELMNAQGGH